MVDVVQVLRRHFSGLDVDKANTPGDFGDTYDSTDKLKHYYWNGASWKTGLGYEFVPKAVTVADFDQTDFTLDGAWHADGIDCSGIVPDGAVAICFIVDIVDDASATLAAVRGNATTKINNLSGVTSHVANVPNSAQGIVYCDSDRKIDTYASAGITIIGLTIIGWYI